MGFSLIVVAAAIAIVAAVVGLIAFGVHRDHD